MGITIKPAKKRKISFKYIPICDIFRVQHQTKDRVEYFIKMDSKRALSVNDRSEVLFGPNVPVLKCEYDLIIYDEELEHDEHRGQTDKPDQEGRHEECCSPTSESGIS